MFYAYLSVHTDLILQYLKKQTGLCDRVTSVSEYRV